MTRFARLQKYDGITNSYDVLKALAISFMIIDHIGYYFLTDQLWLRLIGRFAFPLFFFAIGYSGKFTFSFSVLLAGCAIQITKVGFYFPFFQLDIMFAVLLGRLAMHTANRWESFLLAHPFQVLIAALIWHLALNIVIEYGSFGFLFMLAGYYTRKLPHKRQNIFYFILAVSLLHAFFEREIFENKPIFLVLLFTGAVCMAWLLSCFHMKSWPVMKKNLSIIIRLTARYSFEIYVIHYIAFMGASSWVYPEKHTHFEWFSSENNNEER